MRLDKRNISILLILLLVFINGICLELQAQSPALLSSVHPQAKHNEQKIDKLWDSHVSSSLLTIGETLSEIIVEKNLLNNTLYTEDNTSTDTNNLKLALTNINTSEISMMIAQACNISLEKVITKSFGPVSYEFPVKYNASFQYQSLLIQTKNQTQKMTFFNQLLGYILDTSNQTYYGTSIIPDILNDLVAMRISRIFQLIIEEPDSDFEIFWDENQGLQLNIKYENIPLMFQTEDFASNIAKSLILDAYIPPIYVIMDHLEFGWRILPVNGTYTGYEIIFEVKMGNVKALLIKENYNPNVNWFNVYQEEIVVEYAVPDYIKPYVEGDTYKRNLGNFSYYISVSDITKRLNMMNAEMGLLESSNTYSEQDTTRFISDKSILYQNKEKETIIKTAIEGYDLWKAQDAQFHPVGIVLKNQTSSSYIDTAEFPFVDNLDWIADSHLSANNPNLLVDAQNSGKPIHDFAGLRFGEGDDYFHYNFAEWNGQFITWNRHQQVYVVPDAESFDNPEKFSEWSFYSIMGGIFFVTSFTVIERKKQKA